MINRLSRSMECNPITCCSVTRWASTTHGMKRPQHTKTVGVFKPLERGSYVFERQHLESYLLLTCQSRGPTCILTPLASCTGTISYHDSPGLSSLQEFCR